MQVEGDLSCWPILLEAALTMVRIHVATRLTRLATANGAVRRLQPRRMHGAALCASQTLLGEASFGQKPRFFSVDTSSTRHEDVTTASLFEKLEDAASVVVGDTDLLNAAGAVSSSGGAEVSSGSSLAIVQAVQSMIESVHTTTGLPWWATLAATGVVFRASVFPFYVYQIKSTQRLVQAKSDFMKVISAYRFARTFIPKGMYEEHVKAMLLGKKGYELVLKKFDTRPVQTVLGSLVHIPLFILVAYSARDMIRSGNFEGLETGGFWLWTNLKEVDETYVLPFIATGSVFLNLEVSRRTKSSFWSSLVQYFQFAPILALPFVATLPQGVFFYWIASSWSSLAQTLAMQNNDIRRRLGLPPKGDLAEAPTAIPEEATETKKSSQTPPSSKRK